MYKNSLSSTPTHYYQWKMNLINTVLTVVLSFQHAVISAQLVVNKFVVKRAAN